MKRLTLICGTLAVLALVAAGCGGGDDNSSSSATTSETTSTGSGGTAAGGGSSLKISADPSQLKFDTSSLSASAGKVTITMTNPAPLTHDVSIKGNGVDQKGNPASKGGTSTASADLKPGTYTFYCSIDGHEAAGMKGTLTVK